MNERSPRSRNSGRRRDQDATRSKYGQWVSAGSTETSTFTRAARLPWNARMDDAPRCTTRSSGADTPVGLEIGRTIERDSLEAYSLWVRHIPLQYTQLIFETRRHVTHRLTIDLVTVHTPAGATVFTTVIATGASRTKGTQSIVPFVSPFASGKSMIAPCSMPLMPCARNPGRYLAIANRTCSKPPYSLMKKKYLLHLRERYHRSAHPNRPSRRKKYARTSPNIAQVDWG